MKCTNNLKQLGLACHSYHDVNFLFPPGGRIADSGNWDHDKGSWLVYTLPYLEQDNLYRRIPRLSPSSPTNAIAATPLPTDEPGKVGQWQRLPSPSYMRCPSDGFAPGQGYTNYAGSLGPQCVPIDCGPNLHDIYCDGGKAFNPPAGYGPSAPHGDTTNPSDVRGMFNRFGAPIAIASVSDGTSNTLLIGEVLPEQHDAHANGSWPRFNGGAAHHSTIVPINHRSAQGDCGANARRNWNVAWGFKSRHAGGVNFVFADGSVRFLGQAIEHRTYQLLGCRHDGQPVALP
jgi:prepilin-type processing-associated H-X9-DG protein